MTRRVSDFHPYSARDFGNETISTFIGAPAAKILGGGANLTDLPHETLLTIRPPRGYSVPSAGARLH